MFNSAPNGFEGIADIKSDVEQAILVHCWVQTSVRPTCGCVTTLSIGPETETGQCVEINCALCDAVLQEIVSDIDPFGMP